MVQSNSKWKIIERTAAIAGILGFILSIYILFAVQDINELLQNAGNWKVLAIVLTTPKDGGNVVGHLAKFTGNINFDPYLPSKLNSVRLQLLQNKIQLVPMVRPLVEPLRWWPQPLPAISDNGSFVGTVRLGNEKPLREALKFEIAVLSVPTRSVDLRETYESLPDHYARSEVIQLNRRR